MRDHRKFIAVETGAGGREKQTPQAMIPITFRGREGGDGALISGRSSYINLKVVAMFALDRLGSGFT